MKKGALSLSEWCQREHKPQLLSLYDREKNLLSPLEIAFSSPKEYQFRCPVCGVSWKQKPNKLNGLIAGSYNVIKKRPEVTFCPYCKGERPSPQYNLATELPIVSIWWDYERNLYPPEDYLPSTHQKFYLKCPDCCYAIPNPVRIKDRRGTFRCPRCGDGKQQEVTSFNCLKTLYPQIAEELDEGRNGGITSENILPSYNGKLWFICPQGHRYRSRLSNRTYLNRGCSKCAERSKTSFAEQAVRFYLQKCDAALQSCQTEPYTGREVDILLPSCKSVVEFNSLYCHTTVNGGRRTAADLKKVYQLAQYYRVYIILEDGTALPIQDHPLIQVLSAPVFSLTEEICCQYNDLIYRLLRTLFPERDSYPNIDIMRDQLLILQQYVTADVNDSFEKQHPLLAADWHPIKNGGLTPSMFHSNAVFKFNWICRSCGKTYQMSMANRIKVNPDTCPYCYHKSRRYQRPLLGENYPSLKSLWSVPLNKLSFSQVHVGSEKTGVFELVDGRLVTVRICALSSWLYCHPDHKAEEYLEKQWEKANSSF